MGYTISINSGATADIDNATFDKGGNITNNGGMLNVSNSFISNSSGNGLSHSAGTTNISATKFTSNSYGFYAGGTGTISVTNSTFENERSGSGYFELSSGLTFSNLGNMAIGTGRHGFFLFGNADTVSNQTFSGDTIPYVITVFGVTVPVGKTFTVLPGAIFKFEQYNVSLTINGTLDVQGSASKPVYFTSLDDDTVGGDSTGGYHAYYMSNWGGITLNSSSTVNFNHAILKRGGTLSNNGGTLTVTHSEITGSSGYAVIHSSGTTNISQSSIHGNASYGVYNGTTKILNAENNYWGSLSGPRHASNPLGTGDKVSDYVDFTPYLMIDPTIGNYYSNVMFLPGIMGSNLYDLTGKKVWLSANDTDADYLQMDASGTSVHGDISTKDVMDTANWDQGYTNIYKSFLSEMKVWETTYGITATTTPYDWRLDYDTVVSNGRKLSNGNISYLVPPADGQDPYIIASLKKLASTSKTGKVTIIAHSQGGLITKALTAKLGSEASQYIDKIIFVATPQLGTPQAFAQIMNGTNASIPNSLSAEESRFLAQNMQSAYNLLPSGKYFTYVDDPVAIISTTTLSSWSGIYGEKIHWDQGMYNFMSDIGDVRSKPARNNLNSPEISDPSFLARAKAVHDEMDSWVPPAGVQFTTVAGWGNETLAGLEYRGEPKCAFVEEYIYQGKKKTRCTEWGLNILTPTPKKVIDGDGTVVEPSAHFANGQASTRYWVNLSAHNIGNAHWNTNRDHKNILEIDELRSLLTNILTNGNTPFPQQYISTNAPLYSDDTPRLHFILHSPLTLEFYDALGNHVGYSKTTGQIDYNIPGVEYERYGESQWLSVPKNLAGRVVMNGVENGSFTLDIEETNGNDVVSKTSFEGILSLASTAVSMDISPTQEPTATGILVIDYDGDGGTPDVSLSAKENGVVYSADTVSPVTTATKTGTLGTNGWYTTDVSVSLNSTDTESGVKDIFHSLDNGITWASSTAFIISAEGTTTLQFYSVDNARNKEATSTLVIKIDKIAPEAKVSVDATTKDLLVVGVDLNPTTVTKDVSNTYTITDLAGHTTKLFFQKTFLGKLLTFAKLTGIQYDTATKITLPSSSFVYLWNPLVNPPVLLSQTIVVNDTYGIEAVYDKSKNQTTVLLKKKGVQIQKQVFSGLRIVKLVMNKGTVGYEI